MKSKEESTPEESLAAHPKAGFCSAITFPPSLSLSLSLSISLTHPLLTTCVIVADYKDAERAGPVRCVIVTDGKDAKWAGLADTAWPL